MNRLIRISTLALGLSLANAAQAQEQEQQADDVIVVTAQRNNETEVVNGGSAGVLGDKPGEDLPFAIRSYDESLILNQQPRSLGDVLENDPTIRTTYGFGNASEQFVIRGFTLFGDDMGLGGLYGITPRQLVAPELFESVQVLNGASAFLNGPASGGSGLGGSVNLQLKRAGASDLNRVTLSASETAHFGGSFDVARRFGQNGEWGVRVNAAYRDGETSIDREDSPRSKHSGCLARSHANGESYGGTSILAGTDQAGAGFDTGGNLFGVQIRFEDKLQPNPRTQRETRFV